MTFVAGTGAKAVLRTVLLAVAIVTTLLVRWLAGWAWCAVPIIIAAPLFTGYIPRLTASLYGKMDGMRLYVRYGILWRRETVVPLSALRTFEAWTPPLHRLFKCRTVVLRFAGGCVFLPLLDEKTASRLTEQLEEC